MDNREKASNRDRTQINMDEIYEVQYWSEKFNVTPDELRNAVIRANSQEVKEIERELNHTNAKAIMESKKEKQQNEQEDDIKSAERQSPNPEVRKDAENPADEKMLSLRSETNDADQNLSEK